MGKLGGSGLIVVAILLLLLGIVMVSGILAALIKGIGILVIVVGVAMGVWGLIQMFSGGKSSSSY